MTGGEKMKCPNCGEQMEKIDLGCQCPVCHLIFDVMSLPLKPNFTVSISGLEKIKQCDFRTAREVAFKLNEVIEAVNKMMEVMNERVK